MAASWLRTNLSSLATVVMVACALVVTALVLAREFRSSSSQVERGSELIRNWAQLQGSGHRMGSDSARVTIVEFADFECPACRQFTTKALSAVRERYDGDVAVVFRHWPLSYHRFAYPAARAAECASREGRFEAIHDLLYAKQDSLGVKSFESFAQDAGVADSLMFARCVAEPDSIPVVSNDIKVVTSIGARGTPTIIINGKLLNFVPDEIALDSIVKAELAAANR